VTSCAATDVLPTSVATTTAAGSRAIDRPPGFRPIVPLETNMVPSLATTWLMTR
jgi:hypothetical protein